jgi:hypothetical protein
MAKPAWRPALSILLFFTEHSMIDTGMEFNFFLAWRKENENCLRDDPLGHNTTRNDNFFPITGTTCIPELGVERFNGWMDGWIGRWEDEQTWWNLRMLSKEKQLV